MRRRTSDPRDHFPVSFPRFFHEDNGCVTSNHNESTQASALKQIANLKNINFKENNSAANVKIIKRAMQEMEQPDPAVRRKV